MVCDNGADDNMAWTGRATAAEQSKQRDLVPHPAAELASIQPFNLLTALMQLLPE